MDLPLDEIIKRNKNSLGNKRVKRLRGGAVAKPVRAVLKKGTKPRVVPTTRPKKVVDARLKIIEKTRSKITDARDRLNQRLRQTDARERITGRASIPLMNLRAEPLPRRTIRNSVPFANLHNDYSRLRSRSESMRVMVNNRTGAYMDVDPVDGPADLSSVIYHLSSAMRPSEMAPIHRSISNPEASWLRSGKPSGSFFRPKDDIKSRLEPSRQEGYRIVVSNLQPSVTHEDIKELFEDIGTLLGSRVVRPGTAEVVYKNMEDAIAAVDTYHNRQLDGQPMKCLLVKPSNTSKNLGTKASITPDINTVHRALFSYSDQAARAQIKRPALA